MTKNNAYKKNTFGKYASDFLGKKALAKKANRKARREGKKACHIALA